MRNISMQPIRAGVCKKVFWLLVALQGILAFTLATGILAAGNAERGEQIYRANCYTCHGVDPAHDGLLGPTITGSSRALLKIRLEKGGRHYPKGYKPKRTTTVMPPQAHLIKNLDDLLAYINMDHSRPRASQVAVSGNPAVNRGKALFTATCGGCHQSNGEGKVGLAPSVTDQDFLALVSDDFIKTTIKTGRPGTNMIPFAFLGDAKINDIATYIRSFQRKPSRQYNNNWKARGSARNGKLLYEAVCGQCHGVNGKGYLLGGSGTGIGLNGFLSSAGDAYIKQVMLSGREGTPMRAFGGPAGMANLSDKEMNDIIVYLRALGKKNAG